MSERDKNQSIVGVIRSHQPESMTGIPTDVRKLPTSSIKNILGLLTQIKESGQISEETFTKLNVLFESEKNRRTVTRKLSK